MCVSLDSLELNANARLTCAKADEAEHHGLQFAFHINFVVSFVEMFIILVSYISQSEREIERN